jgi:DNA-binding IclR family transcriptional regulator
MATDGPGRTLKTTRTSLRILELVAERGGVTLAELDGLRDESKSTLHAHLATLHRCRYLVREGDTYRVSRQPYLLGERAKGRDGLDAHARETVDRLADATDQEANFTVFEHGRLVMIYGALGRSPGPTKRIDFRREYYCHNTAAGKAILAELPEDRVDRIVEEWGLPEETDATITTRGALDEALAAAADRGYGVVDEEFATGLVAVGAAVHGPDGRIVGGLSVGGPKYRIDDRRLHGTIADRLREAVEEFEAELES